MERAAFIVEETGERLGCLLNPASVVVSRTAGVRARVLASGRLVTDGSGDGLVLTGGGVTELELELLFDVSLAGSSVVTGDVRELTGPLWRLSENGARDRGLARVPLARFIWGKAWNVPGVVAAIAERLEHFDAGGVPRRSWMSMRFVRVPEPRVEAAPLAAPSAPPPSLEAITVTETDPVHELVGAGGGAAGERLDVVAERYYGDPSLWRLIAAANGIDDPTSIPAGVLLHIPARPGGP